MADKVFGLGVFVCTFNSDFSKILLVKRNEEKRKKWNADWGNIGGKIEFGETSMDACIREAKEETGLNLNKNNIKLLYVKETPHFLEAVHALHFVYATAIDEKEKITVNNEADGYQWFDVINLPDRMIDKKEDILQINKLAKKIFNEN